MKSGKLLALLVTILAISINTLSQVSADIEQGMKPYGSYEGGNVDIVSLTNGNLMLHIPIWSAPQRGSLKFELALSYGDKSFQENKTPDDCNNTGINPCTYFVSLNSGLGVGLAIEHGFFGGCQYVLSATEFDQFGNPISFNLCQVSTMDGTLHTMADTGDGFYRAIDGSGYRMDPNTLRATDANGNISPGPGSGPGSGSVALIDSNGNEMGMTTDTLGRPIPQSTSSGDISKCPNLGYAFQSISSATNYNLPGPQNTTTPSTTSLLFCYANVQIRTGFFGGGNNARFQDYVGTVSLLQSVVLPDGGYWAFQYDAADPNNTASIGYADLLKITFPTGGTISYTWTTREACPGVMSQFGSQTITSRTVDAKDGTGSHTWLYQWGGSSVLVTDPLGNDTLHTLIGLPVSGTNFNSCSVYEQQTDYYQGSKASGALLKTVKKDYSYTGNPYDNSGSWSTYTVAGAVVIRETTILPNGLTSKVETDYDTGFVYRDPFYGNSRELGSRRSATYTVTRGMPVARREYDWGQATPGALLRQTLTTYQWQSNSAYLAANMLNLPAVVKVLDGAGNLCAETDYFYDEANYLTTPVPAVTTQHTSPPAAVRGNLTTVTRKLSATPCAGGAWTNISSHTNWYDTGEAFQSIDPVGNTTTHSYDPAYAGAYLTQTCSPSTGSVTHCVNGGYDFNTGLLTSFTDSNNQTTTYSYDNRWRITQALFPVDSSGVHPETDFSYPNLTTVKRTRKQDVNNQSIIDYAYFDGLGRTTRTQLVDPAGDDFIDTTYDALGRISTVSNPHRSIPNSTDGITTTTYDALDRVAQVTKQDGSVVTNSFEQPATLVTNTDCTTSTDEAGKVRRGCADALGRLREVDEPSPGGTQPGAPGSGSINVSGSLHSSTSNGTKATGSFTIQGGEQSKTLTQTCYADPDTGNWACDPPQTIYDSGSVSVTVNGFSSSYTYQQGDGTNSVAAGLTGGFTLSGSPVTASVSGSTVYLTAIQPGPNYSMSQVSVTSDPSDFGSSSFWASLSGTTMGGGVYPVTTYDSGNLTVTVGGFQASVSYNQNLNNTATAIASTLASSLNASGSPVTASASGTTITMTARNLGAGTDYTVTGSSTVSFTVSNTTLGGGTNPSGLDAPYTTLYTYDPLGNLTQVNQQGDGSQAARVRTFTYDSLSRLLTASNPETGQISYSYDADGNVAQKTSPAPNQTGPATQTISYCYDALSRISGKGYGSQSCPLASAAVTYAYDQGTNGIGHLTNLTDQAGSGTYTYDTLGRMASESRTIAGITKSMGYQYYLDSSIRTLSYPSGAVITYTPDSAGHEISAIDNGNVINYVTSATYGPDGSLTGFISGHSNSFVGITNSFTYNKRLQPLNISAVSPTSTIFSLNYDFHLGAGDNGDVFAITNNKDTTRNQIFTYDQLNRLTSAQNAGTDCSKTTVNGKTQYWGNSYGYDAWGNLLQKTVTKCGAENLSVIALVTNQLLGYGYDAAGNMTSDPTDGVTAIYDPENRISTASKNGVTTTYIYDGDGKRVKKTNGSTGTLYWYMSPGVVAESDLNGNLQSEYVFFDGERVARKDFPGGTVFYYFSDHLKTASVITDSPGNIKEDEDYYPWGGELQFVSSDSNHYKFTGKERDTETGLDYFGKRYHSNALGRFTTPDPLLNSGQPWNPQSWNRYAYVENNPLRYTDPTGLYKWGDCSGTADQCKADQQRFRDSIAKAKEALKNLDPKSKEAKALRSTLKKLGEEGTGDIKINFGDAGKTDGQPNLGRTVGHNITINYDAVDSQAKDANLNASEKAALDAGVTTHEGTHALGNGLKGWFQGHWEHPAYYTESVTYQGLHNTDKAFGLWNESWIGPDKTQISVEQHREAAIQNAIHPPKQQQQQEQPK